MTDDENEAEFIALQSWDDGGTYASAAVVLALLDAGLVKRERMLAIIESLHGILAADYVGAIGSIGDAEVPLNRLRSWLDGSHWKAGQVVEDLRKIETQEFVRSQMKLANSPHRRPPPQAESE